MNRSTKLFLAAGLIAAGYGVATLIGSPSSPYVPRPFAPPPAELSHSNDLVAQSPAGDRAPTPIATVRLLPQVAPEQNAIRRADDPILPITPLPYPMTTAQPLDLGLFAAEASSDRPARNSVNTASSQPPPPTSGPPAQPGNTLHAHFTDAQPRSMRNGNDALSTTSPQPMKLPATSPGVAPPPWPDAFANTPAQHPRSSEVPVAYAMPISSAATEVRLTATVPPPVSPPAPPRMHRVIDGDSLPKLAKRYLHDAGRADEIFAMNRNVLTSPDLLPIGAELKLPAATATVPGG